MAVGVGVQSRSVLFRHWIGAFEQWRRRDTYEATFEVGEEAEEGDQTSEVTAMNGIGNRDDERTNALTVEDQ